MLQSECPGSDDEFESYSINNFHFFLLLKPIPKCFSPLDISEQNWKEALNHQVLKRVKGCWKEGSSFALLTQYVNSNWLFWRWKERVDGDFIEQKSYFTADLPRLAEKWKGYKDANLLLYLFWLLPDWSVFPELVEILGNQVITSCRFLLCGHVRPKLQ